jgi:hypothetical protein
MVPTEVFPEDRSREPALAAAKASLQGGFRRVGDDADVRGNQS